MCGLAGFLSERNSRDADAMRTIASRMAGTLQHRGPDDADAWIDATMGVALAHRRLAVVDLSAAGHQPMHSADGRYVIVYNGEIYNCDEVRARLAADGTQPAWRGHSDTEVILAAIVAWGVRTALERLVGMFAIALWDRAERTLTLARDRIGEKPLYYGRCGNTFIFASELKALRTHPEFRGEVDRDVVALYARFGYVPTPYCIYKGFRKLPPGTYLQISGRTPDPAVHEYWSARRCAIAGCSDPHRAPEAELAEELHALLQRSIRGQMIADVPLGAFLSGGIDSSTVVALMQAQSTRPVRTFSIGFEEGVYDEAPHARAVAEHLRTDHTELYVTAEQAREVIPQLPTIYDEPFADSSQIPTYLVCRLARQHVTVSLSGDGGDELFGGYRRYLIAQRLWHRLARFPGGLRRLSARALRSLPAPHWDCVIRPLRSVIPRRFRLSQPGQSMHRLAEALELTDLAALYQRFVSQWDQPMKLVLGAHELPTALTGMQSPADLDPHCGQPELMMFLDLVSYLPDDILVKVDRAAMAVSLETRIPLLDHRIVEFAWRVPLHYKIRDGIGKRLLRAVLHRYVPQHLVDRPKMGFAVPIDSWLRGPLRSWAEHLLQPERLRRQGFFEPDVVTATWHEHLTGGREHQQRLWPVLMFQAWLDAHHAA